MITKAEWYCAEKEQCCYDVGRKLRGWGADSAQVEAVVAHLVASNFISEERYAHAFARGKFHQQKWGRVKIAYQLREKQLSGEVIDKAIAAIDADEYRATLLALATAKWRSLAAADDYLRRRKLMAYLCSKGFEMHEIQEVMQNVE